MRLCLEAKTMLKAWESTYLDVRRKIEQSNRDERWEFDKTRLFDRTNYMAVILQDMHDISQVCWFVFVLFCFLCVCFFFFRFFFRFFFCFFFC